MKANTVIIGLLLIIAAILIYIYVATPSHNVNSEKATIDSLNTIIINLDKNEKRLDSLITLYKDSAAVLDHELVLKQEELIKQREQYGKSINITRNYTPTQLDSFFTSRFKCK